MLSTLYLVLTMSSGTYIAKAQYLSYKYSNKILGYVTFVNAK